MIVLREECLLLLAKWKNSSARVRLMFTHGGTTSSEPLSSAAIVSLLGTITGVDDEASFLVFGTGEMSMVSVGFSGAEFHFGTESDIDAEFANEIDGSAGVDEVISLRLASGLVVVMASLCSI